MLTLKRTMLMFCMAGLLCLAAEGPAGAGPNNTGDDTCMMKDLAADMGVVPMETEKATVMVDADDTADHACMGVPPADALLTQRPALGDQTKAGFREKRPSLWSVLPDACLHETSYDAMERERAAGDGNPDSHMRQVTTILS